MKIPIYKLIISASVVTYEELIQIIFKKEYEDKQPFLYPVIAYEGDRGCFGKFYSRDETLENKNICGAVYKFDYSEDNAIVAQVKPMVPNFNLFEGTSSTPYLCPLTIMDEDNNISEILAFQICHL